MGFNAAFKSSILAYKLFNLVCNNLNFGWNLKNKKQISVVFFYLSHKLQQKGFFIDLDLHSIETFILRDAAGGTELLAIHSKIPECNLVTLFMTSVSPSCMT